MSENIIPFYRPVSVKIQNHSVHILVSTYTLARYTADGDGLEYGYQLIDPIAGYPWI